MTELNNTIHFSVVSHIWFAVCE